MVDNPPTPHEEHADHALSERFLDLFVFLPTGLAVTLVEELPRLAERGRERLGVRVDSARAVGKLAVWAGGHEFRRRTEARKRPNPSTGSTTPGAGGLPPPKPAPPRLRSIPRPPTAGTPAAPDAGADPAATNRTAPTESTPAVAGGVEAHARARRSDGHVPTVGSLAIPGFDTLSASQVVQRLDGLSRSELVAARAYETATRGRRTILSRVDQLLDERS